MSLDDLFWPVTMYSNIKIQKEMKKNPLGRATRNDHFISSMSTMRFITNNAVL